MPVTAARPIRAYQSSAVGSRAPARQAAMYPRTTMAATASSRRTPRRLDRCGNSDRPARLVSRGSGAGCPRLARTNWLMTTSLVSPVGARARNGSTGAPRPATAPPASRPRRRGAAAQQEQADHGQRDQGPQLDGRGEAERHAAPGQPATVREPVAVEHQQRTDQAEQVQPGLEQEGVRRDQGVRVHGVDPAGDPRGHRTPVPDQQAEQGDTGRVRGRGEQPGDGQAPGAAGHLGQQGHRRHQHDAARRLHHDEVAVRDHAADQPHGVAELDAIVVLGHAEQVARPGQLVKPQKRGGGRAYRDHRVHQPRRLDPAQRNARLGRSGHGDAIASRHDITFCN